MVCVNSTPSVAARAIMRAVNVRSTLRGLAYAGVPSLPRPPLCAAPSCSTLAPSVSSPSSARNMANVTAEPAQRKPSDVRTRPNPSPTTPGKKRVYTGRKTFLYASYDRLFDTSELVLVLQPNNLSVAELSELRRSIAAIHPPSSSPSPAVDGSKEGTRSASAQGAELTMVRAGILQRVARRHPKPAVASLAPLFTGPVLLLTCTTLDPSYLSKVLVTIDRALGHRPKKAPASAAAPVPSNPRLVLLGGLVEGNWVLHVPQLRDVSKLPSLQILRAQIVGLLSAPAAQLAGVLGIAGGAALARTLEGFRKGLEEGGKEAKDREAS